MIFNRKKWAAASIAIFTAQLSLSAQAWNAVGHDIIAQIAYDNLTPIAQQDVNYLIANTDFATTFPTFSTFVYAAPWPDYLNYDVKTPTGESKDIFSFLRMETKSWHYINDPIIIGNYKPVVSPNNSVWAVNYLVPHLIELLQEKNYNLATYDLVFITHIVGDIHQPLHSATLYDADFPNGDVGGNAYKIHSSFGARELHAAWDDSLGQFSDWGGSGYPSDHPPLSKIKATASQFESLCGSKHAKDLNPADWEKESHAIALNFVYPINNKNAPAVNGTLSSNYISEGQKIADTQMCVAGKRLANVLNGIFTTPIPQ